MRARLLDMGTVKELRCESIYHAVTSCMAQDSEPVLSIVHPRSTYVSIGCSQELEKEVDLAYCQDHQYHVFRRDVQGGAFLWDSNQLVFHFMWPLASSQQWGLPVDPQDRFAVFSKPPILTYQNSGLPATFQPANDIYVGGKKIGGMITGEIEGGVVVAGSMMFDFDAHTMSQVLRVSAEKGHNGANSSSYSEMTSMKQELGSAPKFEEVAEALLSAFEEVCHLELIPSMPTMQEMDAIYGWDQKLASQEWLHRIKRSDNGDRGGGP